MRAMGPAAVAGASALNTPPNRTWFFLRIPDGISTLAAFPCSTNRC